MVVSLLRRLRRDPRLLEQVVLDDAALDLELGVEADLHEAAEAGGVVVADRLGISCGSVNNKCCLDVVFSFFVGKTF